MISIRWILAVIGLSVSTSAVAAPWGVQVAACQTTGEASERVNALRAGSETPAFVREGQDLQRVMVGPFEYFVEARLVRDDLRAEAHPDAFIVDLKALPANLKTLNGVGYGALMKPFFPLPTQEARAAQPENIKSNSEYLRLEALDQPNNKEAYESALRETLAQVDAADPLKGYILTNLGICEIIRENYDAALTHLTPVANGEVPSALAHQIMAMRRVAWITHWVKNDRLGAYRAYRQIEQFTRSETVKANCRVECIGLMMELAESGKGTHEEVRAEVTRALAQIPETNVKHRAIIELINSETYARQPKPDHAKAAALSEEFLGKYGSAEGVTRELATATYQAGLFHRKAGNIAKAEEYYDKALGFPDDVESFKGYEPQSQALLGIAKIEKMKGHEALNEDIKDYVVDQFPQSEAARMIIQDRIPLEIRNREAVK